MISGNVDQCDCINAGFIIESGVNNVTIDGLTIEVGKGVFVDPRLRKE
jgi:hypothetical protein